MTENTISYISLWIAVIALIVSIVGIYLQFPEPEIECYYNKGRDRVYPSEKSTITITCKKCDIQITEIMAIDTASNTRLNQSLLKPLKVNVNDKKIIIVFPKYEQDVNVSVSVAYTYNKYKIFKTTNTFKQEFVIPGRDNDEAMEYFNRHNPQF